MAVILLKVGELRAQYCKWTAANQTLAPMVILIAEGRLLEESKQKVQQYHLAKKTNVLLCNGSVLDSRQIADTVNRILNANDNASIDRRRVYLVIAGDQPLLQRHNRFNNDFIQCRYFWSTQDSVTTPNDFTSSDFYSTSFTQVMNHLLEHYMWHYFLGEIEKNNVSDIGRNKIEHGIGINWTPQFNSSKGFGESAPGTFNAFHLNFYRRLGKRLQINVQGGFSLKIPKPQDEIEEQVRSQIDINAIIDGTATVDTADINLDIKGHTYFRAQTDLRYLFNYKKTLTPFVGVGMSYNLLTSISGRIDTSIVIDPDELSSSGFGGDFGAGGGDVGENENVSQISHRYFGLNFSTGLTGALNRRISFDAVLGYNLDLSNLNSTRYVNSLSFQIGLNYRILGKKVPYMEYLRLRE